MISKPQINSMTVSLDIRSFLKNENGVVYDVKGILDREMIDGRL